MEIINNDSIMTTEEVQVGRSDILCLLACGGVCYATGGIGLMAASGVFFL